MQRMQSKKGSELIFALQIWVYIRYIIEFLKLKNSSSLRIKLETKTNTK